MQHYLKDLPIMLSRMAFLAANTHRVTSEGAARLIFPVSVNSQAVSLLLCALNNFSFELCRI
jgi:hypothetical protein